MDKLHLYGWSSFSSNNTIVRSYNANEIGRIISVKGHQFHLTTNHGKRVAELMGRLVVAYEKEDQPKVGDWVQFMKVDESNVFITDVLPRTNLLFRKSAGKEQSKQVLATNLDYAIVVQSLDQDFNLNRLERYLVQIIGCGITPAIVLTKCDMITDKQFYLDKIKRLQREVEVFFCSSQTGEGIPELENDLFKPGSTSVLVGSSGVGKSSLVNALLRDNIRSTNMISDSTNKGKHTTTTRDMLLLPNGAMIIDTPGMREFGLGLGDNSDIGEQFPVIEAYAENCRFSDCSHTNEEGCAVLKAFNSGELDAVIYDNYIKLMREQQRFQTKVYERKQEQRQFGKMVRDVQKIKKRLKGK
ncbi:ribosome small subunit-dependent GTPase A [Fulvivirga lutea]|uniref:Small ribosomal subunit biogenesis GTPase RsgA n=1 Tax=Fulvivirga lutea TaxID=2810512 RepID=A0A975A000_9BACT|nr:ribosome small subunit-dependent GTPase A [Fulvivirga lutea]QSE96685.1 ribosome small subunit-dependent GTPase A [Fulvivirga lutea]